MEKSYLLSDENGSGDQKLPRADGVRPPRNEPRSGLVRQRAGWVHFVSLEVLAAQGLGILHLLPRNLGR
jgi:hypothetical protein